MFERIGNIINHFFLGLTVKISPKEMEAAMHVMKRLVEVFEWRPEAAATAAAMAMAESGFNPGALGDQNLPDEAHGMWQLRGIRFLGLKDYAMKTAGHWADFETQVNYFNAERATRGKLERRWHTLTSLSEGCQAGREFERYAGPVQPKRLAYAEKFLFEWNGRYHY